MYNFEFLFSSTTMTKHLIIKRVLESFVEVSEYHKQKWFCLILLWNTCVMKLLFVVLLILTTKFLLNSRYNPPRLFPQTVICLVTWAVCRCNVSCPCWDIKLPHTPTTTSHVISHKPNGKCLPYTTKHVAWLFTEKNVNIKKHCSVLTLTF